MSRFSDLVQDSKLETYFDTEYTIHIYNESTRTARQRTRTAQREEYWKREREIGGGSYGRVWLEQCVKGQREIEVRAVKQITKPAFLAKPVDYNRELEAISKFSHSKYERCFVKSFGWYESPQAVFIAMEYCEHGDFHTYLSHSPPLPEHGAQQVTFQILEGLSFMHKNGFSHRDLKPSNILVISRPPDEWWVKLGDFGISKRTEDGLGFASTVKGTLRFMPPELLGFVDTGNESDPRNEQAADIWALGEIAFQMLTKEATFEPIRLLFAYVQNTESFPSNRLRARGISDSAVEFIQCLMTPTPNKRFIATQALGHPWMASAPPFTAARPSLVHSLTAPLIEDLTQPSAKWTTVSRTTLGAPTSMRMTPLGTDKSIQATAVFRGENLPLPMVDQHSIGRVENATTASIPGVSTEDILNISRDDIAPANFTGRNARYFILKSKNECHLETSAAHGIWCCGGNLNTRLSNAYRAGTYQIFLIFSVNASRKFCGIAEMTGPHDPNITSEHWLEGDWEGGFPVNWLAWGEVGFNDVQHLRTKEVDGLPITRGRVVFEICTSSGEEMIRRFGLGQSVLNTVEEQHDRPTISNFDMDSLFLSTGTV